MLVPAQMADTAHILRFLHRLNKSDPVAMGASEGVQLLLRSWTRYDGVSLSLSHSANICDDTAVPVYVDDLARQAMPARLVAGIIKADFSSRAIQR